MPAEFGFEVVEARAEEHAAAPAFAFRTIISSPDDQAAVHSAVLKAQVRIEPARRGYSTREEQDLLGLFGGTTRWGDTLRPFLWSHVSATVSGFTGRTSFELHVPCSYDLEVASGKYFHALENGHVPLLFLFSGVFLLKSEAGFVVHPVSWDCEARHQLPVATWRRLMDAYFPDSGWLMLSRETLRDLERFKARQALPSSEAALRTLLDQAAKGGPV